MKRNADKLLAIVQQRDLLQQQLATAQTAPAAKAILASVWKRDPDDVKRDADKLLAIVQQQICFLRKSTMLRTSFPSRRWKYLSSGF